jgi:hypothetical protein
MKEEDSTVFFKINGFVSEVSFISFFAVSLRGYLCNSILGLFVK